MCRCQCTTTVVKKLNPCATEKLKSGNRSNAKRDRRRKAATKAKVDEAVNNAKASIDQATNNNGVDTAKSEGLDAINHVQPVVEER